MEKPLICTIIDKIHPVLLIFIDEVTLSITHNSESVKDIGIWVYVCMYCIHVHGYAIKSKEMCRIISGDQKYSQSTN